jgi:hypothetical protein
MWSDFFGAVSWDFGILSIEIVNFVCYPLIFSHIFIIFLYFFIFFHIFHIFSYFLRIFSYFFIFFIFFYIFYIFSLKIRGCTDIFSSWLPLAFSGTGLLQSLQSINPHKCTMNSVNLSRNQTVSPPNSKSFSNLKYLSFIYILVRRTLHISVQTTVTIKIFVHSHREGAKL